MDDRRDDWKIRRAGIARKILAHIRSLNRLLEEALGAGIRVEMFVEVHKGFEAVEIDCLDGITHCAGAEWAVGIRAATWRNRYPPGGTPFGNAAYCDWPRAGRRT